MILVDVYALQKDNNLRYGSGDYRTIVTVPNGNPLNFGEVFGYTWVRIARAVSQDEAHAIMDQYPTATRSKCEDCEEDDS